MKNSILQKVALLMKKASNVACKKGVNTYCFFLGGEPELPLDLRK